MRFRDIAGHEQAKEYLRGLVADNRVPHSLLISGPTGIGKLMLARAFAQYVHCTDRKDGDSCGECPSCRQHASLNFPDLIFSFPVHGTKGGKALVSADFILQWKDFLDADPLARYEKWLEIAGADNAQPQIKVAESDEIIRNASLSNYLADQKIIIMWLPEKLVPAAANKLLKIIEEPSEGNIFILVSDSPGEILPTIFSRTQRLNLRPLPAHQIAEHLLSVYGLDQDEALRIAEMAEGSLARAEETVSLKAEKEEFRGLFRELMRKAYVRDVDALKEWSEKAAALKREKSRRFIKYAAGMIRNNFLYDMHTPGLVIQATDDDNFSRNFAPFIHKRNVSEILKELDDADRDIRGNANARIVFFDFAIRLIILIKS